jgi:hypothetical protein
LIPRAFLSATVGSSGESIPIPESNQIQSMKTIVTEFQFIDSFRHAGRETQFSVNARRALFEHFEQVEEDSDTEITLDPIGICCEWAEYPSALKAANDYGFKGNENDTEEAALDWLHEQTQVVEFEGGIVIQLF